MHGVSVNTVSGDDLMPFETYLFDIVMHSVVQVYTVTFITVLLMATGTSTTFMSFPPSLNQGTNVEVHAAQM